MTCSPSAPPTPACTSSTPTTGETVLSRVTPVGESGRFSPDGTKLAIRDGAGTVTVIEPTTGTVLLPPVIQARELRNVYFTPDGRRTGGGR